MGKYLDTPQGSLKEDTYHFGIDAHFYKFIVTETTENGETDIFERTIKINPQFVDDKNTRHKIFMLSFVCYLCAMCVLHFKIQHFLPQFQKTQA